MGSDLVESARRLRARPAFALLALLTLTLGIGAGTAVFSVAAGVLLRPPPYRNPEQLVEVYRLEQLEGMSYPASLPAQVMEAWQSSPEVEGVGGYGPTRGVLFLEGRPTRVEGSYATTNLFPLLGIELLAGRGFAIDDDPAAVVVLDEDLFSRALGGDLARVGERVRFDDGSRVVIGVVPQGLELVNRSPQYWLPAASASQSAQLSDIARLAPGVAPLRAHDLLESVWLDLEDATSTRVETLRVEPFEERLTAPARSQLVVLAITAGLVFALACANVAGLFLLRIEGRGEELAIRRSLGASGWRLVRLLLAEGVCVAGAAGVTGALVAVGLHRVLADRVISNVPGREGIALDWRAFGVVLALSVVAALVVSAAPAMWALRRDPVHGLRGQSRLGIEREAMLVRRLAVVVQLAIAVVLVLDSGLVLGVLMKQIGLAAPMRPSQVFALRLLVPPDDPLELAYGERRSTTSVWPLVERLQALPGVEAAAIGSYLPYVSEGWASIQIAPTPQSDSTVGQPPSFDPEAPLAAYSTFAGPLLEVLGIPLSAGEVVTSDGTSLGGAQVLVNERLARDYWPGEDPIGKTLYLQGGVTMTVSGVVELETAGLPRLVLRPIGATAWSPRRTQSFGVVVRTTGAPEEQIAQARALVAELAPHVAVEKAAPLETLIGQQNAPYRVRGLLHASIAILALSLALVGIFGVMSHLAASRTREIGVRLTLGARRSQVVVLLLGAGARLVVVGLVAGLAAAWGSARLLGSVVPELVPAAGGGFLKFSVVAEAPASVWLTVGSAPVLLAVTAILTCLLPANRASRLDPVEALRRS